jgi:spore maturation protein SpmA
MGRDVEEGMVKVSDISIDEMTTLMGASAIWVVDIRVVEGLFIETLLRNGCPCCHAVFDNFPKFLGAIGTTGHPA